MPAPIHYEPPQLILFGGDGRLPVGFGFTCSTGPQAADATCSSGWTASSTCGTGCTAQGCGGQGCLTGETASCNCTSGTSGPSGMSCSMTVCCDGTSGSNWPDCVTGWSAYSGACSGGMNACGGICLTEDPCNPPS